MHTLTKHLRITSAMIQQQQAIDKAQDMIWQAEEKSQTYLLPKEIREVIRHTNY